MADEDFALGGSTKIEKLHDKNFHVWKQKIVFILSMKDLDMVIEEDAPTEKPHLLSGQPKIARHVQ